MKGQKLTLLLFILTILLLLTTKIYAIVNPTKEFYVNDYANILNNETKNYIIEKSKELELQTKAQIVVVTVENLEGESLEKYTTALFNNFLIGDKEKNNGILFLIALKEREIRLEIGTGLDTYITDDISGNILDDYVVSYLKDDKWDEGIKNGYNAVYAKLATYYGLNSDIEVKEPVATEPKKIGFFEGLIIIILIPFFVIINFIFGRIKGGGSRGGGGSSRGGGASRGF